MKAHVLRLITRLNIGGPARQALLLSKGLNADYPTTLAAGRAPDEEGELSDPEVPVTAMPFVRPIRPRADIESLRAVQKLIRRVSPRIVHTHMAKAGAVGRLIGHRHDRIRLVHTFHGHVLEGYFSPRVQRAFIQAERFLAARTDVLVAVSDEVRDALLDLHIGRPEQYEVIPLGFDLEPFLSVDGRTGRFRDELRLGRDSRLVAVVGRVTAIKDHETLLRALAALPDVHLAVVGDGDRRGAAEDFARSLGIAHRTHFVGWRHDLPGILADVDAVVLTSRNEGTPVALIEAGAAARPVVATDVGGVRAVVDHLVTGILVPPGSHEDVRAGLMKVLEQRSFAEELGRAGRVRVRDRYSDVRLLRDISDLYDELIKSPT